MVAGRFGGDVARARSWPSPKNFCRVSASEKASFFRCTRSWANLQGRSLLRCAGAGTTLARGGHFGWAVETCPPRRQAKHLRNKKHPLSSNTQLTKTRSIH